MIRWLLLTFTATMCAHISMDIENMDGQRINQVALGQPFKLIVTLENVPQNKVPEIQNVEQFNARRVSYNFIDINGRGVVRYIYHLQAHQLGTFEIGPACIKLPNYEDYSDTLTVTVAKEEKVNHNKAKQPSQPTTFLRLSVDKEQLVVGEKARCTLTLYTNNRSLSVQDAHTPTVKEWSTTTLMHGQEGEETVDGKKYITVSWKFECIAEKEGTLTFPACAVDVLAPSSNSFGFAALFGARFEAKRIYSNGLSFNVASAPKGVDFIGTIKDAQLSLSTKDAHVGDGLLCSYTIVGQGSFDEFKPQASIPKSCKWYFSQDRTEEDGHGGEKKTYEYIVQPVKEGRLIIPAQTITYFDTDERRVKKIKTNQLECSVAGTPGISETDTDSPHKEISADAPLLHTVHWYKAEQKTMPWVLFILIFFFPFGWFGYHMYVAYQAKRMLSYRRAYKLLQQAERSKSFHQVYTVFSELIEQKQLTHEELITRLKKEQDGIAHDWQQFWQKLTQHVFCKNTCTDYALFMQAYNWLTKIRNIV